MRKEVCIICLLGVSMMLAMVGCINRPNASMEATFVDGKVRLDFEERGVYVLNALGEDAWTYRFDEPNETMVVYKTADGIYLIGEDRGAKGPSYGNIFWPDGEFIALSSKYFLFETQDGKIAVSIERKKNVAYGESFYDERRYEELTEEEKKLFVYPVECEKKEK